jgi:hypothetical protein
MAVYLVEKGETVGADPGLRSTRDERRMAQAP